jgi:hypothetical protein
MEQLLKRLISQEEFDYLVNMPQNGRFFSFKTRKRHWKQLKRQGNVLQLFEANKQEIYVYIIQPVSEMNYKTQVFFKNIYNACR